MLRNNSHDKILDRFISSLKTEKDHILKKFIVEDDDLHLPKIKDPYLTPRSHSQKKSRDLNFLEDEEQLGQKIYLNLLKTQIFESTPAQTIKEKSTEKKNIIKLKSDSINKDLNKTFFNNILLEKKSEENKKIICNNKNINNISTYNNSKNKINNSNYSLMLSKIAKNYLLKKKLFSDNEKLVNMYGDSLFKESYSNFLNFDLDDNTSTINYLKYKSIPKSAYKVLDAPNLKDDFYLHLIDWSKKNIVAVCLENKLYTWGAKHSDVKFISMLPENENNYYSSTIFNCEGNLLFSSTYKGEISIKDIIKNSELLNFNNLSNGRICIISPLNNNPNIFSFGSKDNKIKTIDIRIKNSENPIMKYIGHTKEICGLKWSYDDKKLASGGDDNKLFIWDIRKTDFEKKLSSHTSAIKAIDWSPYKYGYLLSGGGTQDMTLKLWNTNNMILVDSINTESQICNIAFSKMSHEFITTHGYKNNNILVWDSKKMEIKVTLKGHRQRVIYMSLGPDSKKIVTGAGSGDETVRFWNVFGLEDEKYGFYDNNSKINLSDINDNKQRRNINNDNKENIFSDCEIR